MILLLKEMYERVKQVAPKNIQANVTYPPWSRSRKYHEGVYFEEAWLLIIAIFCMTNHKNLKASDLLHTMNHQPGRFHLIPQHSRGKKGNNEYTSVVKTVVFNMQEGEKKIWTQCLFFSPSLIRAFSFGTEDHG